MVNSDVHSACTASVHHKHLSLPILFNCQSQSLSSQHPLQLSITVLKTVAFRPDTRPSVFPVLWLGFTVPTTPWFLCLCTGRCRAPGSHCTRYSQSESRDVVIASSGPGRWGKVRVSKLQGEKKFYFPWCVCFKEKTVNQRLGINQCMVSQETLEGQ